MKDKFYYGVENANQIYEICDEVNELFGNKPEALSLMLETIQQETRFGRYKDPTPEKAGEGITQFDKLPFLDVKQRMLEKNPNIVDKIDKYMLSKGIEISFNNYSWIFLHAGNIASIRIGIIMMRCLYWLVPKSIPKDLRGRAEYWKKYYNTEFGKGTIEEYIKNADNIPLNINYDNKRKELLKFVSNNIEVMIDYISNNICPQNSSLICDDDCYKCWLENMKKEVNK